MEESPEPFRGYKSMCNRVGRRYAQCWFDNYEVGNDKWAPHRKHALQSAKDYASLFITNKTTSKNLIMMGSCGTGKDHLAVAVVRAILSLGINVKYIRGSVLCGQCREHNLEHGSDVPHDMLNAEMLVISDIEPNPNKASDFEERALLSLIDYRYAQMLPTVVTSNAISKVNLCEIIGKRTVSRLFHDAVFVPMMWDDYRSKE
jgi:DNA replication protein DnaC